jgi:hypothetical protein
LVHITQEYRIGSYNTEYRIGSYNTEYRIGSYNTEYRIGSYNTEHSVENFHFALEQEFVSTLKLEISQNSQETNMYYL